MKIQIVYFFLTFFSLSSMSAQTTLDTTALNAIFDQIELHDKDMGSVLIAEGDKVLYSRGFGYANLETKTKNTPATKFRVGSITKTITAVMILQLIESKQISLDTPLSKFFPSVPNAKRINIEHLLQHRSGLFNLTNLEDYFSYMAIPQSQSQMLERINNLEINFEPGAQFEYSNTNYILLGFILEKITGKTYAEVLEEKIVKPLGLTDTYLGQKIGTFSNEAYSYTPNTLGWIPATETDMSVPSAAGAIVSNPTDLHRFIRGLFKEQLTSSNTLQQMLTIKDGYGYGVFTFPFYERMAYGHNGGIDGFVSNLAYFPEEEITISLTANAVNFPFNDLIVATLSSIFGQDYELPDFTAQKIELPVEQLEQYSGNYTSEQFPLAISIRVENGVLTGQATGQRSFPLDAYSETEFRFDPVGIIIHFDAEVEATPPFSSFVLHQAGQKYTFKRQAEK